jgi:hypothetical protein
MLQRVRPQGATLRHLGWVNGEVGWQPLPASHV